MFSFSRYITSSRQVFRNYYLCPSCKNRVTTFVKEKLLFWSQSSGIDAYYDAQHYSSDLLYRWKFWSWKFIKPGSNGGRRSTFADNGPLLPSDVIDFAILPAERLWRETVSLLGVLWPRSRQSRGKYQESRANKTNWFFEGPDIKCFVIYLDFHFNSDKRITDNWSESKQSVHIRTQI